MSAPRRVSFLALSTAAHAAIVFAFGVSAVADVAVATDSVELVVETIEEVIPTEPTEPAPAEPVVAERPRDVVRHRTEPEAPPPPVPAEPEPVAEERAPTETTLATEARTGTFEVAPSTATIGARALEPGVPAPSHAPAASASVDTRGLARGWVGRVRSLLGERALRSYPYAARREGKQGTVVIALVIDATGTIVDVQVRTSSGHDVLDDAAVAAGRAIGHIPAPPPELAWQTRALPIPIDYRIVEDPRAR